MRCSDVRMTVDNIAMFAECAPAGPFGVPTCAEAACGEHAADCRVCGKNYLEGEGSSFARVDSHEKEQGTVSFGRALCLGKGDAEKRKGTHGKRSKGTVPRMKDIRAVLQTAKGFVQEGYVWTTKIRLDVPASIQDERFRSRLAQLVYDGTGDAAAASGLSKALNELASRADSFELEDIGNGKRCGNAEAHALMQASSAAVMQELSRRGHRFVPSEDGVVVFLRSRAAAQRVGASLARYLGAALYAAADATCLCACLASERGIFGLCITGASDRCRVGVHKSLVQHVKARMKWATARSRGVAFAQRLRDIARIAKWGSTLLSLACDAGCVVEELNEWLAARFRMVLWKKWKLVRSRISGLEAAGVTHERAMCLGAAHGGFWAAANSDGLKQALPYSALRRMGFSFFLVEAAR